MYTNNREAYRLAFFTVWQKHLKKLPLEPVEAQLLEVIELHPEYHAFLNKPERYQTQEFMLEENPFLHMSLHIALREQIRGDRPTGIKAIYHLLLENQSPGHDVEHQMMTCLSEMIWAAQQTGTMPSEIDYLVKLKKI